MSAYPQLADPNEYRRLLAQYGSKRAVARALGCAKSTVDEWGQKHGIEFSSGKVEYDDELLSAEELVAAEAEAAKERHRKRLLQELIQERTRTEIIAERVIDAVRALPYTPIPRPPESQGRFDPEEAVLLISDVQGGQKTDAEETGGLGEYNLEIFHRRLNTLVKGVGRIQAIHTQAYNIPRLHLWFLGDIIDGETIFPGQLHHIEMAVVDQVFLIGDAFCRAIVQMLYYFPEIRIEAIIGNHGRIGKKGETKVYVNWDYVLYRFMEARLAAYADRIKWHIPKAWWSLVDVHGWVFLLIHGDDIKSWNSIPYYGIDRADARWTKLLQRKGLTYHYLVMGDKHNQAQIDSVMGEKIVNGSWPGMSMFSLKQLQVASRPSQLMFGVHPKKGKTWTYKVYLDD